MNSPQRTTQDIYVNISGDTRNRRNPGRGAHRNKPWCCHDPDEFDGRLPREGWSIRVVLPKSIAILGKSVKSEASYLGNQDGGNEKLNGFCNGAPPQA
eukprot:4569979-Prymnesium_polylepis.1